MRTNIVNIGNSKGVILPASMLQDLNLTHRSAVQITSDGGAIIIKPAPRQGWEQAAMDMHAKGEDKPIMDIFEDELAEDMTWNEE